MVAPELILASSSPYRRALLERLGILFSVLSPQVDESARPTELPESTALRLSESKARAVARLHPQACIIGSDQVAVLDGRAVGKPGNHRAALAQLTGMSGRMVTFHTAVCVLDGVSGKAHLANVPTAVVFRRYAAADAERYLRREQPYDCAGSAKIEGLGIALVERVESEDPTALIGLPLIAVVTLLAKVGIDVLSRQ
jgi:septum formation protein